MLRFLPQLKMKITQEVREVIDISESTLYPILRRLEVGEMLTVRDTIHNGRVRKYYHITQKGLEKINGFKNEWQEIMLIYKFVTRESNENDKG